MSGQVSKRTAVCRSLSPRLAALTAMLVAVCAIGERAEAAFLLTVDEYLYESTPGFVGQAAEITASYDTSTDYLTMVIKNVSVGTGSADAGWVLASVGFRLPSAIDIDVSSIAADTNLSLGSSTLVNGNGTAYGGSETFDDTRWGFSNGALGHFLTVASLSIDTIFSTLSGDTGTPFQSGGDSMDGVDFGLLSDDALLGGGPSPKIKDALTITVKLTTNTLTEAEIIAKIDEALVVSFGSPDSTDFDEFEIVPEPGSFVLLGIGAIGAIGFGRRRRNRVTA